MNSINHYAYGSIVEWMYRDRCGLHPSSGDDLATGFRCACIAPKPDKALHWVKASYARLFESSWLIGEQGNLSFECTIPFNVKAQIALPDANLGEITINGEASTAGTQVEHNLVLHLESGRYEITYRPSRPYVNPSDTRTPIVQILLNEQVKAMLSDIFPIITMIEDSMLASVRNVTLRKMATTPYLPMSDEQLHEIDRAMEEITE